MVSLRVESSLPFAKTSELSRNSAALSRSAKTRHQNFIACLLRRRYRTKYAHHGLLGPSGQTYCTLPQKAYGLLNISRNFIP